ncbi:hypothetical protein EV715DRAFT_265370 [Schizophyllum commune]
MPPKNASSKKGFPWEDLKAETLRSISLDLLQGTSGKSYLISRTRDTNIAFLKSVAEHGVEEAIRLAIENAPEPQSTSASAARRSASASAPVKRKRDEREEGASNRSTRSKGRADYPYGTRNQGKPQKQLEALGITGPKRQRKSASARPGPLSRTKKGKGASAVKSEAQTTKPEGQSAKAEAQSTKSPKATKLVFDGVEIPKSAAANAFDSISQNGDAEDDDAEGEEEEGEGEEGAEQVEQAQEEQSGEEWEQTADETMKVDDPAPSTTNKSANPYEPSTGDEQEEHHEEEQPEEHQEEEGPPQTDEAQVEEHEQSVEEHVEQSGAEDEPPLTGEIVEATPSEEQNSPAGEIQESSSAEVGTALEDPYVGGDEDAAGEPETDPMQADEGPVDATNDESVMGMQLDVAPENLVPAV